MKIKTSELIGPALDWAVAKCEEQKIRWDSDDQAFIFRDREEDADREYSPSTDWAQGGAIIDQEGISVRCVAKCVSGFVWSATELYIHEEDGIEGPTALVAAMRCYVESKLGDEVDMPEKLL
jgi:hypothetical protein